MKYVFAIIVYILAQAAIYASKLGNTIAISTFATTLFVFFIVFIYISNNR